MTAEGDFDFASTSEEARRCADLYLLWAASADGPASETQLAFIGRAVSGSANPAALRELIGIVEERELESMLFAGRTLRDQVPAAGQVALLALALQVARSDGGLGPGANHVCRFLADLFGIPPLEADRLHRELFGRGLPKPADVSEPEWWFIESPDAETYNAERREALLAQTTPITPEEARLILGVSREADREQIRRAYRRMAQAYHPDRSGAGAGDEATRRRVHARFLRVREAYEVLSP